MFGNTTCPICERPNTRIAHQAETFNTMFCCENCGVFSFSNRVLNKFENRYWESDSYERIKMQSSMFYFLRVVRENHVYTKNNEKRILFVLEKTKDYNDYNEFIDVRSVYNYYPDNVNDKIDMVMELIGTKIVDIGNEINVASIYDNALKFQDLFFFLPSKEKDRQNIYSRGVIQLLCEQNYIVESEFEKGGSFSFTSKGWNKINSLQRYKNKSKSVFIAMSFKNEEPMITAESSIREAIKAAGYVPMIIKDKEHNNFIVEEIMYEIKRSAFVIVDLTTQNQGAYFEAGYAKALGKEVVFTCHENDFPNIHFDAKQISTIKWNDKDKFKEDLLRRIQVTIGLKK